MHIPGAPRSEKRTAICFKYQAAVECLLSLVSCHICVNHFGGEERWTSTCMVLRLNSFFVRPSCASSYLSNYSPRVAHPDQGLALQPTVDSERLHLEVASVQGAVLFCHTSIPFFDVCACVCVCFSALYLGITAFKSRLHLQRSPPNTPCSHALSTVGFYKLLPERPFFAVNQHCKSPK